MQQMLELLLNVQQEEDTRKLLLCNNETKKYGLCLSVEDSKVLLVSRRISLAENNRIEFRETVLPALIYAFCNSAYINQNNYVETLKQLQEMFYLYKSESQDKLTDTELIDFMSKQFEEVCFGDLEYLQSTCLERFARAVRAGYQCNMQKRPRDEYTLHEVENEYYKLNEETRWDYEIFKMKLGDLF